MNSKATNLESSQQVFNVTKVKYVETHLWIRIHWTYGVSHPFPPSLSGPEISHRKPRQLQTMALRDEHIFHLDVSVKKVNCVCRNDEMQQLQKGAEMRTPRGSRINWESGRKSFCSYKGLTLTLGGEFTSDDLCEPELSSILVKERKLWVEHDISTLSGKNPEQHSIKAGT